MTSQMGPLILRGTVSKVSWNGSVNTASPHTPEEIGEVKADKNRAAKVDFRDLLMILSGC